METTTCPRKGKGRVTQRVESTSYLGGSYVELSPETNCLAPCSGERAKSADLFRSTARRRRHLILGNWHFGRLMGRHTTTIVLSMIFLLALGQESTKEQPNETPAAGTFDMHNQTSPKITEETRQSISRSSSLSELGASGSSMNRNSLISGDSLLQRQLREKAKQDSLESIKMHILMRLNLKKLPNITTPIMVPQQILENFYKNYNTSVPGTTWGQKSKSNSHLDSDSNFNPSKSRPKLNLADRLASVESNLTHPGDGNSANKKSSSTSSEMMSDDPNSFRHSTYNPANMDDIYESSPQTSDNVYTMNDEDMEHESILSHINSVYIFPEKPHLRHHRRTDVLRFKLDTGYSEISYITLHLYLRGLEWIKTYQPQILEEVSDYKNEEIIVAIHRAIRRANSTTYTHKAKIFEFRSKIPSGLGQWISVDLKPLMGAFLDPSQIQEIFIKGVEPWMRPLVVTTDTSSKNPLTFHIEIGSRKKHRRKRSVYLDCTESDHDMRCCRYPLKVNFTSFGWHFVVAPTSFDAYFCSGDCRVGYLEQYPHTHLAALTTSATPCCSPTKMSSLSLLYFDDSQQLVLSVIPNMSVEGCSCS